MSRCEWPVPACESQKARPVEIVDAFGERRRVRYCSEHIEIGRDPQKMADLHESLRRTWYAFGATVPPETLHDSPAQKALTEHNEACGICGVVAAYVRGEINAGRVAGAEGVQRIGEYIVAHACEVGVYLNEQAGLEMRGR